MQRVLCSLLLIGLTVFSAAEEGKWTPPQLVEIDTAVLQEMGLRIPPKSLWDPATGTGLLSAAVSIGGCSAAFVSDTGLIATNHHCIFGILQEHSTRENHVITNGFLARSRSQELPGRTTRVTVPRSFQDVTNEIERAAAGAESDLARQRAITRISKELVAACETRPARRCQVAQFDGGVQYILQEMMELRDVRLVYAPPRAVGEFGGEIDNWMWPRHAGDFGIARAYVSPKGEPADFSKDNVPFRPERFIPVSRKPLREGDFVMVLGYPGTTYRSLLAEEMRERRDLFFPRRIDLFGEWIRTMEEVSAGSEDARIAVAADLKTLLNRYKNAQGQIDGFRRGHLLERQRKAEEEVLAWAAKNPQWEPAAKARVELLRHFEEQLTTWERDFLLSNVATGPKSLYFATTLVRLALESQRPDLQRDEAYMERSLPRLRANLERQQKSYSPEIDRRLLLAYVKRALALPAGQRIPAIDGVFSPTMTDGAVAAKIDALYASTKVLDFEERKRMARETPEQLRQRRDPLLDLGFALESQLALVRESDERWKGAVSRLRPAWRRAVIAHASKPVAPDANSTLRLSFAHVKGYSPRDAVVFRPFTTLAGMLEKHTGEDPFEVPARVRKAAEDLASRRGESPVSRWIDSELADLPVNFLATGDTTGGNSGSPMLNGDGELVGLNFDRVWENVANDFGYNPSIARNVSVDIRYLLWTLESVERATELLNELKVLP